MASLIALHACYLKQQHHRLTKHGAVGGLHSLWFWGHVWESYHSLPHVFQGRHAHAWCREMQIRITKISSPSCFMQGLVLPCTKLGGGRSPFLLVSLEESKGTSRMCIMNGGRWVQGVRDCSWKEQEAIRGFQKSDVRKQSWRWKCREQRKHMGPRGWYQERKPERK